MRKRHWSNAHTPWPQNDSHHYGIKRAASLSRYNYSPDQRYFIQMAIRIFSQNRLHCPAKRVPVHQLMLYWPLSWNVIIHFPLSKFFLWTCFFGQLILQNGNVHKLRCRLDVWVCCELSIWWTLDMRVRTSVKRIVGVSGLPLQRRVTRERASTQTSMFNSSQMADSN